MVDLGQKKVDLIRLFLFYAGSEFSRKLLLIFFHLSVFQLFNYLNSTSSKTFISKEYSFYL